MCNFQAFRRGLICAEKVLVGEFGEWLHRSEDPVRVDEHVESAEALDTLLDHPAGLIGS